LLIEEGRLKVLIDPGRYSWESHLINPNHLPDLSHIVITHEHNGHYDETALRMLSQRFSHATVVTNNDLAKTVKKLKLPNPISSGSDDDITVFEAPHEPLPFNKQVPLNIGVHIGGFTHPGDALDFKPSRELLALPISAPAWTNLKIALEKTAKLKPKKILPIHDWHWHQRAREEQYARIREYLGPKNIEFIDLENGQPVEI